MQEYAPRSFLSPASYKDQSRQTVTAARLRPLLAIQLNDLQSDATIPTASAVQLKSLHSNAREAWPVKFMSSAWLKAPCSACAYVVLHLQEGSLQSVTAYISIQGGPCPRGMQFGDRPGWDRKLSAIQLNILCANFDRLTSSAH